MSDVGMYLGRLVESEQGFSPLFRFAFNGIAVPGLDGLSFPSVNTLSVLSEVVLVGICVTSAATDLTRGKIPDWLTWPAIALGMVLAFMDKGWGGVFEGGLISSVMGAGFCGLVFGVFAWKRKGFGVGDVQLMIAVGSLAGFLSALTCAMCATLVGGGMALLRIGSSGSGLTSWRDLLRSRKNRENQQSLTIPYGLAIALGVIWASLLRHGWLF